MTTYQGFDVLEVEPNWRDGIESTARRSWLRFDPGMGKVTVEDKNGRSSVDRPFSWFMEDRAAIAEFKAFVAARKGKAVPFWFPSWTSDLQLAHDVLSVDLSFPIVSIGYTKFLFPQTSRRFMAFLFPNGTKLYREVTVAVDPGDGITETLTIDSSLGIAAPSTTLISILSLCRLGDDSVKTEWRSINVAEASLSFREIPQEVP